VIKFDDRTVSAEHAVLAYIKGRWTIRDLGSRNGTRVNGSSLKLGDRVELSPGAEIHCGSVKLKLVSDGQPGPAVVGADGTVLESKGGVLSFARDEASSAILLLTTSGWALETRDGERPVRDGDVIESEGQQWTVTFPSDEDVEVRSTVQPLESPLLLSRLTFEFVVSREQDFVEIALKGTEHKVAARACNHLLLMLARHRLSDAALVEAERGWMSTAELGARLTFDTERLNVEVFRARAALAALGVVDASRIIERRVVTRQLRIGTDRLIVPAVPEAVPTT
jgi:hypothetical protein